MSSLALPYSFTPGTLADANQVNANGVAITTWANGNISNVNINAAAGISLTKLGLNPGGTAFNQSTTGVQTWASGLSTDSVPRVTLTTDQGLKFGPGLVGALDVELIRSAANTLQLNNTAGGPATLDMFGGTITNVILGTTTVTNFQVNNTLTVGKTGTSTGTIIIDGLTSGTYTMSVPAIAGTGTLTLGGASTMTIPAANPTANNQYVIGQTSGALSFSNTGPRFVSPAQVPTANTSIAPIAHGFAATPVRCWAYLVNTITQLGYAVGDTVQLNGSASQTAATGIGIQVYTTATGIGAAIGAQGIAIINKGTNAVAPITAADWNLFLVAEP